MFYFSNLTPFLVWLFPVSFFAYQFILRLWPGLMMQEILNQFAIDASQFGLLAASYYYGYAGMQIPIALLLNRFGTRAVLSFFALICGLATWLFTYTDSFYVGLLSRFLIGSGSAAGFLSVSKVVSDWFLKKHYSKMIGFSFSLGLLGAVYGGKPIALWVQQHTWQSVSFGLGLISIFIGCMSYFFLKDPIEQSSKDEIPSFQLQGLKELVSSPFIWLIAFANLFLVGSLEGFADVWGVKYLALLYGTDDTTAAGMISFLFMGMLLGGPFLAWLSQKIGKHLVISLAGFIMAMIFVILLGGFIHRDWLPFLFWVVGMMCCYQVIVFSIGADQVPTQYLGLCTAFLNSVNMLGGSFFHTLIGFGMDRAWEGSLHADGSKIYTLKAYEHALMVIPFFSILGGLIFLALWLRKRMQPNNQ